MSQETEQQQIDRLQAENRALRALRDQSDSRWGKPDPPPPPKSPDNLSPSDRELIGRALHLETLYDTRDELAIKAEAAERDFQGSEHRRRHELDKVSLVYSQAQRELNADPENPVLGRAVNDAKRAVRGEEMRLDAERRKEQEVVTAARHVARTGGEFALPELRRMIGLHSELFELDERGIPRVRPQFRPQAAA